MKKGSDAGMHRTPFSFSDDDHFLNLSVRFWIIFIVSGMAYAILPTLDKGKEKEKSDKAEDKDRDEE